MKTSDHHNNHKTKFLYLKGVGGGGGSWMERTVGRIKKPKSFWPECNSSPTAKPGGRFSLSLEEGKNAMATKLKRTRTASGISKHLGGCIFNSSPQPTWMVTIHGRTERKEGMGPEDKEKDSDNALSLCIDKSKSWIFKNLFCHLLTQGVHARAHRAKRTRQTCTHVTRS